MTPFSILSARLQSDTPVCGVAIEPYVLVRRADGTTVTADEVPEEGYTDARFSLNLGGQNQYRYKEEFSLHPECLKEHWHFHVDFHNQSRNNAGSDSNQLSKQNSSAMLNGLRSPGDLVHLAGYNATGETWVEVGNQRCYIPTQEDVGCVLRYECTAYDSASAYPDMGKTFSILTSRVRPSATPPMRSMIHMTPVRPTLKRGKFTVLSYNLLADLYASAEQFGYCPSWALHWPYRRANLLRELLAYNADIMCLQEVSPRISLNSSPPTIDGCATFFKKNKFALVKKYEVEFNKAALSLADSLPPEQKSTALSRLLKDNVALIAVLEALVPPQPLPHPEGGVPPPSRRKLICIANTHIHSNPELSDIKLWQVHTLLKGLEKIATSADIPMLVAGDFNSVPGSAAHNLLVHGTVPLNAVELSNDPAWHSEASHKAVPSPAPRICVCLLGGRWNRQWRSSNHPPAQEIRSDHPRAKVHKLHQRFQRHAGLHSLLKRLFSTFRMPGASR
eukprot:jgi/Picre1/28155/NNA_003561.t1